MRRFVLFLFLIVLQSIAIRDSAKAQWVNMTEPYVGNVTSLAVSGSDLIAACEYRGLFTSNDLGVHWNSLDSRYEARTTDCLFSYGSRLFAGYYNGVLGYIHDGTRWIPDTSTATTGYFPDFAFSGSNIFIATSDPLGENKGGLFRSTDNGSSWTKIYPTAVSAITVSGDYLLATVYGDLLRSSDNGDHWTSIPTSIVNMALAFYNIAGKVYTLTGSDSVFVSTDQGTTWSYDPTTPIVRGASIVEIPDNSGDVQYMMGTGSGVFLLASDNTTWIPMNTGLTNTSISALVRMADNTYGSILFAGTSSDIFYSTNKGASWVLANSGIARYSILSLTTVGTKLIAGSNDGGAFYSTDDGTTWAKMILGSGSGSVSCFAGSGSNLFAGTGESGVFLSSDSGITWNAMNTGLTDYQITALEANESALFAGTYNKGIFRSTNSGASWELVNSGLTDIYISSLAASGTHIFMGEKFDGVYRSIDNGASWEKVITGLTDTRITSLEVSGTILFAGTVNGYVSRSTDNGTHWTQYNSKFSTGAVSSLLADRSYLYAGTDAGIFLLENNGAVQVYTDSGKITMSGSLALHGSYLFAGGYNGIWRRPILEMTAVEKPLDILPTNYCLQQNYPNPFNPTTTIKYEIPSSPFSQKGDRGGFITLKVYNLLGQEVATLFEGIRQPGSYSVTFDGSKLASGIYFYKLKAADFTETKKFVLIK